MKHRHKHQTLNQGNWVKLKFVKVETCKEQSIWSRNLLKDVRPVFKIRQFSGFGKIHIKPKSQTRKSKRELNHVSLCSESRWISRNHGNTVIVILLNLESVAFTKITARPRLTKITFNSFLILASTRFWNLNWELQELEN